MKRSGQAYRFAVGVTLAAAAGGCGESGDNKLIGSWRLAAGSECTIEQITFTPQNVINRNGANSYYPGRESTVPVFYVVDGPNRVTATNRDHASSVTYVFSDDDHMAMGDNVGCAFERVS